MKQVSSECRFLRRAKSHLEIMEDFRCCDRNGDGLIDFDEFRVFMEYQHADLDECELLVGFRAIDSDRNGLIDPHEALAWWRSQ